MKLPPPVLRPKGQPMVCVTWPGLWFSGKTSHSSFMPIPNFCGSRPSGKLNLAMISLASDPRTPSAMNTYLPRSSMPG